MVERAEISDVTEINSGNNETSQSSTGVNDALLNFGGRPSGSTKASKSLLKKKLLEAKTEAAVQYQSSRLSNGNKLANGTLKGIISYVEKKFDLPSNSIRPKTIRSRFIRKNLDGTAAQRISPLVAIEPLLVEYCKKLALMGAPLTRDQVISLATDLIKGTDYEKNLLATKKLRQVIQVPVIDDFEEEDKEVTVIGVKWYYGFMRRNCDEVKRAKGYIRDINRFNYCTYSNFELAYNCAYEAMVVAKVATKLDKPTLFDADGKIVTDPDLACGLPTQFMMTKPTYCLFVDETGKNTNQKNDGQIGGQQVVLPTVGGDICSVNGAATDIHVTVLCFTAATGEPVMAAVIFKSKKKVEDLPLSTTYGIMLERSLIPGANANEIFLNNCGEDKAMRGGPTCTFMGKTVPCYIGASPKASITSTMLADMLRTIDSYNFFDRSDGTLPFLLLDGHHSRLELPFLNYIHEDPHKWIVCIGVPYGTHLWQVADSEQLNGSFSTAFVKAKRKMYSQKRGEKKVFYSSDIIPLINSAWERSFARSTLARHAIAERGWGPLTYNLLLHPCVRREGSLPPPGVAFNVENGQSRELLDLIVDNELRNKGKQQARKKRKLEMDIEDDKEKKLRLCTRMLTSGNLMLAGHTQLTLAVKEKAKVLFDKKESERLRIEGKKIKRQQDTLFASNLARHKFQNKNKLTRKDLIVLIREQNIHGDSPVRKSIHEMRQQLDRRMHRLSLDFNLSVNVENDLATTQEVVVHEEDNSTAQEVIVHEDDSALVASILESMSFTVTEVAEL